MLQALAALLPIVESLGASGIAAGSTAAATGTAAQAGAAAGAGAGGFAGLGRGLSGLVNKAMGTVEAFGSPQQLGEGVQQAQQIADVIATLKGSIGSNEERQRELIESAKPRRGEVDPYTGAIGESSPDRSQDPEHLKALAELQQQRTAFEQESRQKNAQLVDLHARIGQTTNPRSPLQTLGQVGGMAAGGGIAGQLMGMFGSGGSSTGGSNLAAQLVNAPKDAMGWIGSLLSQSKAIFPLGGMMKPVAQAALQPFTDLGMNRAERNVASGAVQFGTEFGQKLVNPFALMRGEPLTHLAKLPGLLAEWGEGLVESKRHLMAFNGTLAQSFLEAERRGLIRNIESGQRTSGATAGLSDALQDLQDTLQPVKDVVTTVMARGVEALVREVTAGFQLLRGIYEAVKTLPGIGDSLKAAEKMLEEAGRGDPNQDFVRFLREVNNRDITQPRRIPRR